jgi:hypothetical protein
MAAHPSQPGWPQSQRKDVIPLESWQKVEQYFSPLGGMQVQQSCAHFFDSEDMVTTSQLI